MDNSKESLLLDVARNSKGCAVHYRSVLKGLLARIQNDCPSKITTLKEMENALIEEIEDDHWKTILKDQYNRLEVIEVFMKK